MKYIFLLLIFIYNPLIGQDDSWTLKTFSYLNYGTTFDSQNNIDLLGSYIESRSNLGQSFILEKRSTINTRFSILLGAGFGYNHFKLNFLSTVAFKDNPFNVDISESISGISTNYLVLYTGLANSKSITPQLQYNLKFRGGMLYPFRSFLQLGYGARGDIGNSVNLIDAQILINDRGTIYPMIMPEFELSYKMTKIPFCIDLGLGSLIVPFSILNGEVTLFGNKENYIVDVSENVMSLGVTVSLTYMISE